MTGLLLALLVLILLAGFGYLAVAAVGQALHLPQPIITFAQIVVVVDVIAAVQRAGWMH